MGGVYTQDPLYVPTEPGPMVRGALSPKKPSTETAGLADIFPYYAGFSFEWACSRIGSCRDLGDLVVLDPWNGSGTTTLAASSRGQKSIGVDRNPVANAIARLRCLTQANTKALDPPKRVRRSKAKLAADPLACWFSARTVSRFRDWLEAFRDSTNDTRVLGTVAVFRVVRELTKSFEGSNPTWVKWAKNANEVLDLPSAKVDQEISAQQEFLIERFEFSPNASAPISLLTADSGRLPIANCSVDTVLTSPPYLTRIDYAVAYARELAVLGFNVLNKKEIRHSLMGTTLTRSGTTKDLVVGPTAGSMLSTIERHSSKASAGYYLKQARQYLGDLTQGLSEISRVSKNEATLQLVVQDSYYKDVPVPLADICIEESEMRGWILEDRENFPVRRLLTSVNSAARAYDKGEVAESVITFRRKTSGP
jgi:hypothetical protein